MLSIRLGVITQQQIVQPVPSLHLSSDSSGTEQDSLSTNIAPQIINLALKSKRHMHASPSNSPHKLGNVGPKRRRTINVSPRKTVTNSILQEQTKSNLSIYKNLNFEEQEHEKATMDKLFNETFAYFLLKLTMQNSDSNLFIKPLREFLLPSPAQLKDCDPSLII